MPSFLKPIALAALPLLALALATPSAHAQFNVTNFQELVPTFANPADPYGFISEVQSISNNGAIAGTYTDSDDPTFPSTRGYIYQNGIYTSVSAPNHVVGDDTALVGINNNGLTTGYHVSYNAQRVATGTDSFIRSAAGTFSMPLPTPTATINRYLGINDAGLVATQYIDGGLVRSAVYDINTNSFTQFLPDIGTGNGNYIQYVGSNGTIVGNYVNGINDLDNGAYLYQNGAYSTFRIAGSLTTRFNGINATGIVSGRYDDAANISHGLLYNTNTGQFTFFDYPDAVETIAFAGSINDSNQIVGNFLDQNDVERSFTATAVAAPEPGSIALLLTAGVPIAGLVRRRKK